MNIYPFNCETFFNRSSMKMFNTNAMPTNPGRTQTSPVTTSTLIAETETLLTAATAEAVVRCRSSAGRPKSSERQ